MNSRTTTFHRMISNSLYLSTCTDVCLCAHTRTQKELCSSCIHTWTTEQLP